jgi:hypothetical protein
VNTYVRESSTIEAKGAVVCTDVDEKMGGHDRVLLEVPRCRHVVVQVDVRRVLRLEVQVVDPARIAIAIETAYRSACVSWYVMITYSVRQAPD